MKISLETSSRSERLYGRPFIVHVSHEDGGAVAWGTWRDSDGTGRVCEIDVPVCSVIMTGVSNSRNVGVGTFKYQFLDADGKLSDYMTKTAAMYLARTAHASDELGV